MQKINQFKRQDDYSYIDQGKSQVNVDDNPLYKVQQFEYFTFPHCLIGIITAQDKYGRLTKASGALITPTLVITAAHSIFRRKCTLIGKEAEEQLYTNIRFHLAPNIFLKIQEGTLVVDYRFSDQYKTNSNFKQHDYAILKLSNRLQSKSDKPGFMKPTAFKCQKCLMEQRQKKPLLIFGYPIYEDNYRQSRDGSRKTIYQYGLERRYCVESVKLQRKQIFYKMNTYQGQSGSPIILGQQYIGIHTRGHQDKADRNKSKNQGLLFTQQVLLTLTSWAIQMNQIPFNRGAKPICKHVNRDYTFFLEPMYDKLNYTKENLEDIQQIGHQMYPDLKYLYLSENRFTWIDLSNNVGLLFLFIAQNKLLSINITNNINLIYLDISSNNIISLDISHNTKLKQFLAINNRLHEIDVSKNNHLKRLMLQGNQLISIDLSQNRELQLLSLAKNRLSQIDISFNNKLKELYLDHNHIKHVYLECNKELTILYLHYNKLRQICLTENTKIQLLNLEFNHLQDIDLSHNLQLQKISLRNNQNLKAIDLRKHTKLMEAYLCINRKQIIVDLKLKSMIDGPQKDPSIIIESSFTDIAKYWDIYNQNQKNRYEQAQNDNKNRTGIQYIEVNQQLKFLYCEHTNIKQIFIPMFCDLRDLYLRNNFLKKLNLQYCKQLHRLYLSNNNLKEINLINNIYLKQIIMKNNELMSIDLSQCRRLKQLRLSNNKLMEIDLRSNTQLELLWLNNNQLKEVNIRANTQLIKLGATNNKLKQLDLSKNTRLTHLWLHNNQIRQIDLDANISLAQFGIVNNKIKQIDLRLNTKLTLLQLSNNLISSIDLTANLLIDTLALSNNTLQSIYFCTSSKIVNLWMHNNCLQQIDLTAHPSLENLALQNNMLRSINLNNNLYLKQLWLKNNRLKQIDLRVNSKIARIGLSQNKLKKIDLRNSKQLQQFYFDKNYLEQIKFHFFPQMNQNQSKFGLFKQRSQNCHVQITYREKDEQNMISFLNFGKEYIAKDSLLEIVPNIYFEDYFLLIKPLNKIQQKELVFKGLQTMDTQLFMNILKK